MLFHSRGFNCFCILLHASICVNINYKDISCCLTFIYSYRLFKSPSPNIHISLFPTRTRQGRPN
eukprot:c42385_g1_i1 orf=3-191(-)